LRSGTVSRSQTTTCAMMRYSTTECSKSPLCLRLESSLFRLVIVMLRQFTYGPIDSRGRGRHEIMSNALYYGDNLDVLRESIPDESVDLIYLARRTYLRPSDAQRQRRGRQHLAAEADAARKRWRLQAGDARTNE
jgi:hypothetical protein